MCRAMTDVEDRFSRVLDEDFRSYSDQMSELVDYVRHLSRENIELRGSVQLKNVIATKLQAMEDSDFAPIILIGIPLTLLSIVLIAFLGVYLFTSGDIRSYYLDSHHDDPLYSRQDCTKVMGKILWGFDQEVSNCFSDNWEALQWLQKLRKLDHDANLRITDSRLYDLYGYNQPEAENEQLDSNGASENSLQSPGRIDAEDF